MKTSSHSRLAWASPVAWVVLGTGIVGMITIPGQFLSGRLMIYAFQFLLSVMLVCAAVTTLMLLHRQIFQHAWIAAIPAVAMGISNLFVTGGMEMPSSWLSTITVGVFLAAVWSCGIALALFLYYNDASLKLFAWGSVIYIWSLVVIYRFYGSFIEFLFTTIAQDVPPGPQIWLNPLCCFGGWLLPIGFFSFVYHTGRIVKDELFRQVDSR